MFSLGVPCLILIAWGKDKIEGGGEKKVKKIWGNRGAVQMHLYVIEEMKTGEARGGSRERVC